MKIKIRVLPGKLIEIFVIVDLLSRTGTVPETHLTGALFRFEEMRKM